MIPLNENSYRKLCLVLDLIDEESRKEKRRKYRIENLTRQAKLILHKANRKTSSKTI